MIPFWKVKEPFFDKPDGLTGAVIDDPTTESIDDDTDLMSKLIDDKKPEEKEEEDEEPEKEENLLDDEGVEKPEDDLVDTNIRAIDFKKIKEKYSDFAKTNEYRELRNSYHREAEFTELFPTIDDAREAAENNETFNKINDSLIHHGDPTTLLNAVKEASPESLKKITSTFLDSVAKIDNQLYIEAITPVIKRAARQIYNEGNKFLKRNSESDDGKALIATARNIMNYFDFDPDKIDQEEPRNNEPSEKEKELTQRENAIKQEKFQSAASTCQTSLDRHLDKQIMQGLDPDNKFNDFTRDTLVEKIKKDIESQISKDNTHIRRMTSLWKRAEQDGFSRESLSRIVSAYLERARPIIPTVRNKYRTAAMGRINNEDKEEKTPRIVSRGRSGKAPQNDGRINVKAVDSKKIDYRQTSDDDIFEGKIKLKGA